MKSQKSRVPFMERVDDLTLVSMIVIMSFTVGIVGSFEDAPLGLVIGYGVIGLFCSAVALTLRESLVKIILRRKVKKSLRK